MQASCTAQQGISSTGAVLYGRVSPEPGRALVQGAVAAGNAAGEQGGGSSGGRGSSSGGGGGDGGSSGCRDEELVAVLKVRAPRHSRCLCVCILCPGTWCWSFGQAFAVPLLSPTRP